MFGTKTKLQQNLASEDLPYAAQYYVLVGKEVQGPCRADQLRKIPGFTLQTLMRISPAHEWKPAFAVVDLKAYFGSAQKSNSWDQAAAAQEKARLQRLRHERRARVTASLRRVCRRLFYMTLLGAVCAAVFHFALADELNPKRWQPLVMQKTHVGLQELIRQLQQWDRAYFAPPTPIATMRRLSRPKR